MSSGGDKSSRPSPSASATLFSVGERKKGNDGNLWEISTDKNGVKRWKKTSVSTSKKSTSSSKSASNSKSASSSKTTSLAKSKVSNDDQQSTLVFSETPTESVKVNLANMIDKILDKKLKLKHFFYSDSYGKKPQLNKDEENLVLAMVKKVAKDYDITNLTNIVKFSDIFIDGLTISETTSRRRSSYTIAMDAKSLVEKLGPPELRGFVAKDNNGIFIDGLLAPGENSHGYGIYHDTKQQITYWIFQNWDGQYIPKPKFKTTIKRYIDYPDEERWTLHGM